MKRIAAAIVLSTLAATPAAAHPPRSGPAWTNPVLDRDFADPAVLRAPDGWYYAYATQATHEKRKLNVQVAKSPDLRRWTFLGDAMPTKPAWASTTQDF